MITVKQKGKFKKLNKFLDRAVNASKFDKLDVYGNEGVELLRQATPKDTGKTADSWEYKVERKDGSSTLTFYNTNIQNGTQIAVIIDNGYVNKQGTWVEGYHYIEPALEPLILEIIRDIRKEV